MKRLLFIISSILAFLILLNPSPVFAFTWTKHPDNPVLDLGPTGSWDDTHVSNPAVLFDGTNYKMWYGGHDGANWRIGYATSPDGLNWTKYEGNPVLELRPEPDGEKHVTEPTVIFDGENYEMWFTSELQVGSRWRIGYATSSDGTHWDRHQGFVLSASEGWEADGVATPFVLKAGTLYKMWYAARDNGIWRIGYASSENGTLWAKHPSNPVLTATQPWEGDVVVRPSVIITDTMYQVWYHAGLRYHPNPKLPLVIDFAYSTDGVTWTKPPEENPALQRETTNSFDDSLIVGPSVLKRGDVYQMWYGGNDGSNWRIGYASTDEIPPPKTPLVLLPGLGASWNFQKIFFGEEVPQSEWKMTPFVKHYDNLINTLESAGHTKNEDLFVFNYDWTKPVDQVANDLKDYIDETVDPPKDESSGKEITLIGHSLGGLVARSYIQENLGHHQVNQLITLGSPHHGAVQAYQVWEGADFHDLLGAPLRLGAELVIALRGRNYSNRVEAVRNIVPSLKDLLFIDDYLKKHPKGKIIPESSLSQQNLWLKGLGMPDELKNILKAVVGKIDDTLRWLKVCRPSRLDQKLGRWQDGKPVGKEFEIGDKSVLASSAGPQGTTTTEVALDHSDLVRTEEGIEVVLSLLGLEGVTPATSPYPPDWPILVFALASPGNLRVTNPLGEKAGFDISPPTIPHALFLVEEKMVVIPSAIDGDYHVEVVADDESGPYRLLIGHLTEKADVWRQYQGEIATSATDTHTIKVDNALEKTPQQLARLISSKLEQLFKKVLGEKIPLRQKIKIQARLMKILGEFKSAFALLKSGKDKAANKLVEKALLDSLNLAAYLEKNGLTSLLEPTRDMIDHLDQLHQLLSS